jgi:tRNA nucleotidyltransferase (CCA-adding enzyme)
MPGTAAPSSVSLIPEVFRVGEAIRKAGGRPLLVGGWVRDMLLGIAHRQDFDIEVFGLPMGRLRNILARIGPVHSVGRHFGVLKLKTHQAEYDVSVPRRESNIGKGHRGFHVEPDPHMSFEEAAARRDFTINAMGYAFLEEVLLDPFGGERDLRAAILRHVGPAFAEDPLRVLRAMQFAGRFGFRISPETLALCRSLDLGELPRERIWEEFKKLLLQAPRPSHGLAYAEGLGVLAHFPELARLHGAPPREPGGPTPWSLTLAMLDRAALLRQGHSLETRVLMTAALCHQINGAGLAGEPAGAPGAEQPVESFLARLTNEAGFVRAVLTLIAELDTPQRWYGQREQVTDGEVRRLALRIALPFLLRAARARHEALSGGMPFAAGAWLEERARALGVWEEPPQPILKGRHLMARGVPEGPAMGDLLERAFERQLDGDIANLAEALAWLDGQSDGEDAAAMGEGRPPPRPDAVPGRKP